MKNRIIAALVSTLIFSLFYALLVYTPEAARLENHWYESFSSLMILPAIFTLPAYLIGGVPLSILIDRRVKVPFLQMFLYLLAGFIVGILTVVISFKTINLEVLYFGLYGLLASFIFYLLLKLMLRRLAYD